MNKNELQYVAQSIATSQACACIYSRDRVCMCAGRHYVEFMTKMLIRTHTGRYSETLILVHAHI